MWSLEASRIQQTLDRTVFAHIQFSNRYDLARSSRYRTQWWHSLYYHRDHRIFICYPFRRPYRRWKINAGNIAEAIWNEYGLAWWKSRCNHCDDSWLDYLLLTLDSTVFYIFAMWQCIARYFSPRVIKMCHHELKAIRLHYFLERLRIYLIPPCYSSHN